MRQFCNLPFMKHSSARQWLFIAVAVTFWGCATDTKAPVIAINCTDAVRQVDQVCDYQFGDHVGSKAEVRIRGNSSLQYPKKSMRLEVDSVVSFCDLPAHDVWVLNANYIDKSFIRHRLSFDLFRAMGAHNLSPNGCYREVEVNGDYRGVYFIHERIDQERCGILDQQPGGVIYKEPPVFLEENAQFEPGEHPWGQKYPDDGETDMSELALEMQRFLNESADSVFAAEIGNWFHLENVADWMLLLMLTNNTDGIYRNFYLYRLHEGLPFRVAIWDYDETFGRYGDNRPNNIDTEVNFNNHPLLGRLLKMDSFRNLLRKRWLQHRQQVFSEENIMNRIDTYTSELETIVPENFNRWPIDGPGYFDDTVFSEEIGFIRDFIQRRLITLDRRITEM